MTEKQKIFVNEYLIDLNATRAYKVAYPSCKKDESASVNASKLLRNTKVAEYLQERMCEREQRTEITQDMVLKEFAKIAFFNAKNLFADNGQPLRIRDLEDDVAACITGIKIKEMYDEDGAFIGYEKEYKLADKKGALDSIGKHLGMFTQRVEVDNKAEQEKEKKISSIEAILQQMKPAE